MSNVAKAEVGNGSRDCVGGDGMKLVVFVRRVDGDSHALGSVWSDLLKDVMLSRTGRVLRYLSFEKSRYQMKECEN